MPSLYDPLKESASGRKTAQRSIHTCPVEMRSIISSFQNVSNYFFFKRKLYFFKALHPTFLSADTVLRVSLCTDSADRLSSLRITW